MKAPFRVPTSTRTPLMTRSFRYRSVTGPGSTTHESRTPLPTLASVVRGLTPGSCPGLSLCDEPGASQSTGGGHTARLGHVTPSHQWPLGVVMVQPSQGYPVAGGGARRYAGPHGVRRRHGGSGVVTLRSRRGAAGGTLAGLRSDPRREGVLAWLPR